ncbi:MAG TPA: hypothetical protein DIV86_03870 [Alphaproteobacteria bacterium]|nr:hypothetical protein [Alphaproteobacteria bacterium]
MRYIVLTLTLGLISTSAYSQSLADQINAVDKSYQHEQSSAEAANRKAIAAERARKVEAQAREAAKQKAQDKLLKRDLSYEDELRKVELENLKLELQARRTRVERSNEFIDQELKEQAAGTDLIQSNADAVRNISDGVKEKMKSQGRAEEKKAKGFWGF